MLQDSYISVNGANGRLKAERDVLRKMRQEKCVLYSSIAAIAFSLVGISGTIVLNFKGTTPQTVTTATPLACVACSKFIKIPSEGTNSDLLISKLTPLKGGNELLCCAYNSNQMSILLELTMRRPEIVREPLPEFDPKHFTFSSVSAHKRLYLPTITNATVPIFYPDKLVTTLFKPENDPFVEHFRGVDVLDNGLKILQSGQYMIYSNIHFRPNSVYPCKNFAFQSWGHYVEKITPNDPASTGCILKTSHTCCDQCTGDDETSFTSGVFKLASGDIIRVSVSGHGLIYFGRQSSFAGLMMLGG